MLIQMLEHSSSPLPPPSLLLSYFCFILNAYRSQTFFSNFLFSA